MTKEMCASMLNGIQSSRVKLPPAAGMAPSSYGIEPSNKFN